MRRGVVLGAIAAGVMGGRVVVIGATPSYTFVDLHPAGGYTFSEIVGVSPSGAQQVGRGGAGYGRAALWSGSTGSFVDLHPGVDWYDSFAVSAANGQQVGYGDKQPLVTRSRALLWTGTADSVVDLTPAGWYSAKAQGTDGIHQVGSGYPSADGRGTYHAVLWSGAANTFVDLHPTGDYDRSEAWSISGTKIVGLAGDHAALWSGLGATFVDLHPAGYVASMALAISGNQQVGYTNSGASHAALWYGTADSFVDLHPATGYVRSRAYGTNGVQQVGYGDIYVAPGLIDHHALVWSGSADSVFDLQQFVPSKYPDSFAMAIDAAGNIYGYVWDERQTPYAAMWVVPEPSLVLLALPAVVSLRRRRQTRQLHSSASKTPGTRIPGV